MLDRDIKRNMLGVYNNLKKVVAYNTLGEVRANETINSWQPNTALGLTKTNPFQMITSIGGILDKIEITGFTPDPLQKTRVPFSGSYYGNFASTYKELYSKNWNTNIIDIRLANQIGGKLYFFKLNKVQTDVKEWILDVVDLSDDTLIANAGDYTDEPTLYEFVSQSYSGFGYDDNDDDAVLLKIETSLGVEVDYYLLVPFPAYTFKSSNNAFKLTYDVSLFTENNLELDKEKSIRVNNGITERLVSVNE